MKEYSAILSVYSLDGYSMYSHVIPASRWGDKHVAEDYLKRYWLSSAEYEAMWRPLQDRIFSNQEIGLPEIVFQPEFELQPRRGGCLFDQEEFLRLQECILGFGEKFLFVIENTFGGRVKEPIFRMKFPSNICWEELTNGNFASAIMLEMPHKEYFVFGETGTWGKYAASDFKFPLDVLGFKRKVGEVFREKFKPSEAEEHEITQFLPPAYRKPLMLCCAGGKMSPKRS